MSDLPVACTLTPAELDARRNALLPGLAKRAVASESLPDGGPISLAVTGPAGTREFLETLGRS